MDGCLEEKPNGLFSPRFWERDMFLFAEGRGIAVLLGAASALLAFLLARGHALFGAYPFALAYLAVCDRRLPFAAVGAIAGALTLGGRGIVYALAYVALLCVRLLLSKPRKEGKWLPASPAYFEEEPPLRVAAACFGTVCHQAGAACSYIHRGDRLFRIRSGTLPIGILDSLDAEKITFDVEVGDTVVMLSDGVSQAPEESAWLCEMLSGEWPADQDDMAQRILEGARSHAEGGDDMTVALIEIRDADTLSPTR